MSNTRESVSSYFQTPRNSSKILRTLCIVFSTFFSVFGNVMKHSPSCLIITLKQQFSMTHKRTKGAFIMAISHVSSGTLRNRFPLNRSKRSCLWGMFKTQNGKIAKCQNGEMLVKIILSHGYGMY